MISIALATYNGERYLRFQLDSIYNQTFTDFEVVVCDDCSTDSTVNILEEYSQQFGLKYYVNSERFGFVRNFEKAIGLCKGEFIALCDQDDIWLPDKLAILSAEIKDYSLCCSDAFLMNSAGEIISNSVYSHSGIKFHKEEQFNYLIHGNFVMGCTMLFKKDLLGFILPFPADTTYHDWWISIVASLKDGIQFIDMPLIKYRTHGDNQSPTALKAKYNTLFRKIKEVILNKELGYYNRMISWLSAVKTNPLVKDNQKVLVNEKIDFYNDMKNSIIHFRSFVIALKYRKYLFAKRGEIMRFLYAFASLFI